MVNSARQSGKIEYNDRLFAGVAQSVEQLICNQPVAGSIPIASSNKIKPLGVCLRAFFMSVIFRSWQGHV